MSIPLKPVKADSLKEACITRFEELILSGKMPPGQKLPPERELALQLGVSRPVVHDALVDIAAKGLVSLKPRIGAVVNDYRREGSLALLNALLNYPRGNLDPKLLEGLFSLRALFEVENARLAAVNRTREQAEELKELVRLERAAAMDDRDLLTELDFEFHLQLAIATGNFSFPLLLNSFRQVYTNLTGLFFSRPSVVSRVLDFHHSLSVAVDNRDEHTAKTVMNELLAHGETVLKQILGSKEIT